MPSVNVVQTSEPRLQPPPAAQSQGVDPFSELLDSAVAAHHAPKESNAGPHKGPNPSSHASRHKSRSESVARGDTPEQARPHKSRPKCEGVENCAKPAESADESEIAETNETSEGGAAPDTENDAKHCKKEVANGCSDAVVTTPATDELAADDVEMMTASEGAVQTAKVSTEMTVAAAATVTTETAADPAIEPNLQIVAAPTLEGEAETPQLASQSEMPQPTSNGPATDVEGASARPAVGLQQALTAAASASGKPASETPNPAAAISGNSENAKQSPESAQVPQPSAPGPAKIDNASAPGSNPNLQLAQQQDGQQVAEVKPLKAAGFVPADNAAAPPPPNDAPKIQVNPTTHTPMPEPVRALAASFNPANLPAASTSQPNAVPLNANAIAIEIASRMREGMRRFEIRLDPPELGRIDVRLEVDRHGHATTKLTVDRPETLDLLQREARGLERALQQAGLKTDQGGLEFTLRQQTNDGPGYGQPDQPKQQQELVAGEDSELIEAVIEGYRSAARARGGVDIKV